jgi:hypothetical protein
MLSKSNKFSKVVRQNDLQIIKVNNSIPINNYHDTGIIKSNVTPVWDHSC